MSTALVVGVLAGAGIYLLLHRGFLRVVIGILLLQHAVNLLLVSSRAPAREQAPLLGNHLPADPLPQAFVITAIVVGFGAVLFLLALARRSTPPPRADTAAEEEDDTREASP